MGDIKMTDKTNELLPCPFCGSDEWLKRDHKFWTGQRDVTMKVTFQHWCQRSRSGLPLYIERQGSNEEEAIRAVNMRP